MKILNLEVISHPPSGKGFASLLHSQNSFPSTQIRNGHQKHQNCVSKFTTSCKIRNAANQSPHRNPNHFSYLFPNCFTQIPLFPISRNVPFYQFYKFFFLKLQRLKTYNCVTKQRKTKSVGPSEERNIIFPLLVFPRHEIGQPVT